jgi:hypothetical protein
MVSKVVLNNVIMVIKLDALLTVFLILDILVLELLDRHHLVQ